MREYFQKQIDEGYKLLMYIFEPKEGNESIHIIGECDIVDLPNCLEFVEYSSKNTPIFKEV